ncbi:MAG: hypothetical protein WC867_06030 [Candidatus Pacearchaeota archaeon]|jgi:hypothetical protein
MKKALFGLPLFLIPLVSAEECGLLNISTCLPQKLFEFFINILNAPIQPLLSLTKSLLTEPIKLELFVSLWAIIIYIISIFYGLLMLYSGFNFIISGYDAEKRNKAKEWFKNIFIMIVLVQASYFLYSVVIDLNSLLTAGIVNLIDPNFFLITADNITNIGLQFFFGLSYVVVLIFTVLFLTFRYIIVAAGIIFLPLGIFLYFIPPVNNYGRLIINFLGISIFVTFFDSIILLVCSRLIDIDIFQNFKILVMIAAFLIVNFIMFYFMIFSAMKSAIKTGEKTAIIALAVGKYFV